MSAVKRAWLYLRRKMGRTVILLAVLAVLSVLVLLCISVGNAADTALQNLRKTMGGYFRVSTDYEKGGEQQVDEEMVKKILEVEGIKAWNGLDTTYLLVEDAYLKPGRFTGEGDYRASLARFFSCSDTSLHEYFFLHSFSLAEGRHITPEDSGKALISRELADLNGLAVGDTFSAGQDLTSAPEEVRESASAFELEIVGIYEIDVPQVQSSDSAECDMAENFIFTDTDYIRRVKGEFREEPVDFYSSGAAFFVENPKEQSAVVAEVLQIPGYDWEGFELVQNNKNYEDSAGPLERMAGLITAMILAILLIGVVLVTLVLFLWMRDRVHEIGVFLSLGIRKRGILGQHLLENLLTAAAAFLAAWCISAAAAGQLEHFVGDAVSVNIAEEAENGEAGRRAQELLYPDPVESRQVDAQELVKVRIGTRELAEVAGAGVLLILVSTGVASGLVLRMKPKEIFSNAG